MNQARFTGGSGLEKQMQDGTYRLQTEKNLIEEQRLLIENLDGGNPPRWAPPVRLQADGKAASGKLLNLS